MNIRLHSALLLTVLFAMLNIPMACSGDEPAPAISPSGAQDPAIRGELEEIPLEILSVNNSLIFANDQPSVFMDLCGDLGVNAEWVQFARMGTSLHQQWMADDSAQPGSSARDMIASRPWTHIILQDRSTNPLYMKDEFFEYTEKYVDFIRKNCPNRDVEIIILMNWPESDNAQYLASAVIMRDNTLELANSLGIKACPTAEAYIEAFNAGGYDAVATLHSDNIHPSVKGTLLSAMLEYALITGEIPEPKVYLPQGVTAEERDELIGYVRKVSGGQSGVKEITL